MDLEAPPQEYDRERHTAWLHEGIANDGWWVHEDRHLAKLCLDDELVAVFSGTAAIHAAHVRNLLAADEEPDTHDCREGLPRVLRDLPDVEVGWPEGGLLVRTIGSGLGWQGYRHWPLLAAEDPAALRAHAAVLLGLATAIEEGPPPRPAPVSAEEQRHHAEISELVAFAGEAGKVLTAVDAEKLHSAGARIVGDALMLKVEARWPDA